MNLALLGVAGLDTPQGLDACLEAVVQAGFLPRSSSPGPTPNPLAPLRAKTPHPAGRFEAMLPASPRFRDGVRLAIDPERSTLTAATALNMAQARCPCSRTYYQALHDLCLLLRPRYGYVHSTTIDTQALEDEVARLRVNTVPWAAFYGRDFVAYYGMRRFLRLPAAVTPIVGAGVFVLAAPVPSRFTTAAAAAIRHGLDITGREAHGSRTHS